MTPTAARHAKQGLYLANLGFVSKHLGHIGRWQHLVMNSSESSTFGGNDEEHARHNVVLLSSMISRLFLDAPKRWSWMWSGSARCDHLNDAPRFLLMIDSDDPSHLSQIARADHRECTNGHYKKFQVYCSQQLPRMRKRASRYRPMYIPRLSVFKNKRER